MSVVTDLILTVPIGDEDENGNYFHAGVDRLNHWLLENINEFNQLKRVEESAGGTKAVQCFVYMAAINHLDVDGFIDAFKRIDWDGDRDYVQLLVKQEDEMKFTLHELAPE